MVTTRHLFIFSSILALSGCAHHPQETWDEDGKKIVAYNNHSHHLPRVYADRKEGLTSRTRTPGEIHSYDVGRLPRGNGGMDEAHRYYRVVQSDHWDLRLPSQVQNSGGAKTIFNPPTAQAPLNDERVTAQINEAQARQREAIEAKGKLEGAADQLQKRMLEDNNLRGELIRQQEMNRELKEQIDRGFSSPSPSPSISPTPTPATTNEELQQWQNRINGQNH
jgi:hypothetical protein